MRSDDARPVAPFSLSFGMLVEVKPLERRATRQKGLCVTCRVDAKGCNWCQELRASLQETCLHVSFAFRGTQRRVTSTTVPVPGEYAWQCNAKAASRCLDVIG